MRHLSGMISIIKHCKNLKHLFTLYIVKTYGLPNKLICMSYSLQINCVMTDRIYPAFLRCHQQRQLHINPIT
ncbi:Os03g0187550 [Oryza sativa Japonica Group]|uniref:Os03g0187550 protein n=1 Tax=Oryza sativa subsp. japonica TaxID=39947 RepID=A0A0P0VU26_ORYSJ|nr:hypothetical protein EE612_015760 [Oryza sativa]BAS82692.1 Os03g0187550 [Oryza sativa Japonica Group]